MFGFKIVRNDKVIAGYEIADRGGYYVVRRHYKNGNVKSDRLGSSRAASTLRSAVNGRYFA